MKILQNNTDRTILINSETNFGTDLGWEENFQEFEQETLKQIINPVQNFETVRYVHSGYTSNLGVNQNDLWYYFYFSNFSGGTDNGLNYEFVGLSSEENSKLLRSNNTSFFRLEFYKVPEGENPNSNNRKLVFTKHLPIPMGEKVFYRPINQEIFVPVFMGSNDRNKENMNLYWFQDGSVLEGTTLSGNTFYLAIKYYNTIDGTSIPFLNKPKNVLSPIDEEEDIYRRVEFNQDNYTYVIYSGITTDNRGGTISPIKSYSGSYSNSSLYPFVVPTRELFYIYSVSQPTSAGACAQNTDSSVYFEAGYTEPYLGMIIYTTISGTTPFAGDSVNYYKLERGVNQYTVRINNNGIVLESINCS